MRIRAAITMLTLLAWSSSATASQDEGVLIPTITQASVARPLWPPKRVTKPGSWFNWKVWTPILAAQVVDILSTKYALRTNPLAREANPLLLGGHDSAMLGKLGVGIFGAAILSRARPIYPKLCTTSVIGIAVGTGATAVNNVRLAQKEP